MKSLALFFVLSLPFFSAAREIGYPADSASLWKRITYLEGRYLADFPETFSKVELLLNETLSSDCIGCQGRALMLMGEFFWANGQYAEGLTFFRKSIDVARAISDFDTWAKATDFIANTYYYQAYYDSAEYYFQKAYAIADEVNDVERMILILHNTSLMYHRRGDFTQTVEYIFRGEKLKDELPESQHHIEAMGSMGTLMIDSIYYLEEIGDELKNVAAYQSKGDTLSLYYTYHNLGKAYRQLENYKTAAGYFVKAAKTMKTIGFVPEWDLAAIDYRHASMKDSCFYFHYLAKQDTNRATQPNVAFTFESLGDAHLHFKQYDSARYYYETAISMDYRMNNRITFTGIHRNLVRVHTLLGNFGRAEYHLLKGLSLAKEVALIHEKNLFQEGQFLYETKGDYKTALYYSEKFKEYMDSLNSLEAAVSLTRMQVEFKTAKKESELSQLTQENLFNEEKIKTRTLQVVLALLSIILVGSFGGLYYSKFKLNKKISEELKKQKRLIEHQYEVVQNQNNEKEALLHEIHHRVKNNLQIISSLINIKSRTSNLESKEILNGLSSRIHSLGLIHEMLYKSDHLGSVDLKAYLTEQSKLTLASLEANTGGIELVMEMDEVETNLDSALAFGLISNELITNAIKYAFSATQQVKTICVSLRKNLEHLNFSISDNGSSSPDVEINKSFGLRFVDQLVRSKLNGELHIKHENGLRIEMIVKPWI